MVSFSMFIKKVALYIKRKDRLEEERDSIVQKIKKRASYYGIYKLNERVEEAHEMINASE